MTKAEEIVALKARIDAMMKRYESQYQKLAQRSEKRYDETESLKQDYEKLNNKTQLNELFAELGRLKKTDDH